MVRPLTSAVTKIARDHMKYLGDTLEKIACEKAGIAKPDTPFHDLTGVKRAWRGRGIARALKHTQLNWAKAEGYRSFNLGLAP